MASTTDLAERVRAALKGAGALREVKMFGGIGFMLNGNLVAAASPRGLLLRVGKEGDATALAWPGTRPMVMRGRKMAGYVRLDADGLSATTLRSRVAVAVRHVQSLPAKPWASKARKKA